MEDTKINEEIFNKYKKLWLDDNKSHHTVRWQKRFIPYLQDHLKRYDYVISDETINSYLKEVNEIFKDSQANLSKARSTASSFLTFLNDKRILPVIYAKKVYMKSPIPRTSKEVSDEEIEKLRKVGNDLDNMIMTLLLTTAARLDEASNIKRKDVTWDNSKKYYNIYIRKGKGNKSRNVMMINEPLFDEWFKTAKPNEYLFKSPKDDGPGNQLIYNRLARLSKKADIERIISPHIFRHRSAQNLYRKSKDLILTSRYLGHSQVQTTLIYLEKGIELDNVAKYMKNEVEEDVLEERKKNKNIFKE